ncbi:MAG: hypothetical protein A2475_03930 [Ignavibacteria bacterium RIFOXYC2_FULL_35_21]|nr:MAG: hypothetical protein A2220_03035 [Ignavibacteria bacterium RIFOXYA2_FULL_35_10]OGV21712.1 MAG: hypothetical protein A2475_03930 [Ignavibacteria bacterium RIFOXYC2_FULL_35_21]
MKNNESNNYEVYLIDITPHPDSISVGGVLQSKGVDNYKLATRKIDEIGEEIKNFANGLNKYLSEIVINQHINYFLDEIEIKATMYIDGKINLSLVSGSINGGSEIKFKFKKKN